MNKDFEDALAELARSIKGPSDGEAGKAGDKPSQAAPALDDFLRILENASARINDISGVPALTVQSMTPGFMEAFLDIQSGGGGLSVISPDKIVIGFHESADTISFIGKKRSGTGNGKKTYTQLLRLAIDTGESGYTLKESTGGVAEIHDVVLILLKWALVY